MRRSPAPFLFAAALALLGACRRSPAGAFAASAGPAVGVRTAAVTAVDAPVVVEVPATVRPAERAVIAARLTGTVSSLPWGLGQNVRAGDVLVTLAAPESEARVRQAEAQLAEATRAAARERELVAKGVNPPDSLRTAEDRLHFAQAALAEAQAILAFATVRAPFDGIVTEKPVLPGDLASPGLPLLTLEAAGHLRAEGTIPDDLAARLHPGDLVGVLVEGRPDPLEGRIEELSTAADAVSRSVLAKVALPAGLARSGQFVRLRVPAGAAPALLVPSGAVTVFGQMELAFVAADGHARLHLVRTGRMEAGRVEIVAGLAAGDRVVLDPPAGLRDGTPVIEAP